MRMQNGVAIKTHYGELTEDDVVFFKTGGLCNQHRAKMTYMNRLIDDKMNLWLQRADKGKKYAKRKFLEEHVVPYAQPAYACEADGSLRLLSEEEIRGKMDEIFKARKKKRRSAAATKRSKRTKATKKVVMNNDHSKMSVSVVSGSEKNDSDADDDSMSTFGSLGDIDFDCLESVCTSPEDDVDVFATTANATIGDGLSGPEDPTEEGPTLSCRVSLDPSLQGSLEKPQLAQSNIARLIQAKMDTASFVRHLFGSDNDDSFVTMVQRSSQTAHPRMTPAQAQVQHLKDLYHLLVLLQRRLEETDDTAAGDGTTTITRTGQQGGVSV